MSRSGLDAPDTGVRVGLAAAAASAAASLATVPEGLDDDGVNVSGARAGDRSRTHCGIADQ
jgi:hypothetical protein